MEVSRSVVVNAISGDAPVYGVNTGFGALADTPVGQADLTTLQGAIVRSHAAGVGVPLDDEAVRAVLLLRARTLAAGYSGVRVELPARLLELLSLDLLPVIPGKGSVGASGDLAQLAHLAQPLIGEGRLRSPGDPQAGRPAAEVLREHGLEPLTLAPKEGLSLVNGTEPMQVLLAFSVHDARDAGAGGGCGLRAVGRGAARHRPALRRAGPGDQAAPGSAGQRGQPARAACRVAAAGQPPAQQARGAGRVLPALRAAGARGGQGRARLRPAGDHHRAGFGSG